MDTKGYKIETLFGLKHLLAETVEETHWNRKRQDYPSAVLLENRPVVIHTRGKTNFYSIKITMIYLLSRRRFHIENPLSVSIKHRFHSY